jgi:hypothetical protein
MSDISITAMTSNGGPSLPSAHDVWLEDREWPGGGTVKVIRFRLGSDVIQVWPADTHELRQLHTKLGLVCQQLEGRDHGEGKEGGGEGGGGS